MTLEGLKSFYKKMPPTVMIPRGVQSSDLVPIRKREEVREEMNTPDHAPVMIYIGSLSQEKRVDRILVALEQLRAVNPDLYLWIIGDGPERYPLEQKMASFHLESRVRFAGPRSDVANFLNASDLFVLMSETEGIPGAVLEAAILSLPSVAARVGGVPECIVDGQTGILVDPSNTNEVTGAIQKLIKFPDLRADMGKNAKAFVSEGFSMEKIAKRYTDFFDGILRAKHGGGS
jgi:glycosyltransferase involved in cell wall biosynthesis